MGGKKKKASSDAATKEVKEAVSPKKSLMIKENWINIDFRLLNWKYMNFTMKFRENTHIFTIKKILQERHEANEVLDEMLTLKECGLRGQPSPEEQINTVETINNTQTSTTTEMNSPNVITAKTPVQTPTIEKIPTVLLFYDFKPTNSSDPVILYFK